jgi:hypothetical protein
MALNGAIVITVTKIVDGPKKAVMYNGTGRDITIVTANLKAIHPAGSADEDSIYEMVDGTLYYGIEDFDATTSELSATDRTGS